MYSIRIKIAAITIVAILTSILSVFAACYSTIQRENNRRSVETIRLIDRDTRKSLEKYFDSIEQSVEMVANIADDALDCIVLAENGAVGAHSERAARTPEQIARTDDYLAGYSAKVQEAFSSVASHTYGVVTYYYCINPEVSENEHGFFYSMVGKTGFYEQPPLDARELDPDDLEHTTWYYTTIERGRPSWLGPYTAHFLGEMLTCSYIMPIYKAGTLIGVLGMDIPFDTLIEQVKPIRFYETGYACLYDADGHVLYHPELPFGSVPEIQDPSISTGMLKEKDSGNRLIRYMSKGEERQLCFSTLSNGMKLVLTVPVREVNASWTQLSRIVILITAGVIVFYAALVMVVMRFITRPLARLTAASRRLADEDYDVELRYNSKDEVGILTSAFNQMREQLKSSITDLNHRVYHDSLTGLPNMRCFFKQAENEKKQLIGEGKCPVLLFFNLIGMQHYNRQYGFEEGDRLICDMGNILSRYYAGHSLCRFGDDHFAVLTEQGGHEKELRAFLRDSMQANGGNTLPVRVGVYSFCLEDVGINVACDRAKYACDRYRNFYDSGVYTYDERMLKEAENVRYIISHFDQALSERWIGVYYQPIVRAINGRVCDEEALSRWVDPVRGVLSPGIFIPVLENARLIYKLDLYVLEQVLEKMNLQKSAGLTAVPHSVNLSRSDFDACDMVEEIRRRVDAAGINREKISIEITESVIGSDFDFMSEQVRRFHELGFPVWMDDFGSGYSSLDVLQSIPFELIKFDLSFMKKLNEGERSRIILTELMQMATSLGVDTVCEGVETVEQVQFLQEIGCSKLQGYYFGKPQPLETILASNAMKTQIEYENQNEAAYYEAIGRVNLSDLTMMASTDEIRLQGVFNTIPMGVMEIKGDQMRFVRSNQSYRDLIKRYFNVDLLTKKSWVQTTTTGPGSGFLQFVRPYDEGVSVAFFDEKMPDGSTVHAFSRRVAVNPITGTTAVAVAVLSIM